MTKTFPELKAEIAAAYYARRDGLGWKGKNGQLTKAAEKEALSWLVGVEVGLNAMGETLGPIVWLASIRGVEDVLGEKHLAELADKPAAV